MEGALPPKVVGLGGSHLTLCFESPSEPRGQPSPAQLSLASARSWKDPQPVSCPSKSSLPRVCEGIVLWPQILCSTATLPPPQPLLLMMIIGMYSPALGSKSPQGSQQCGIN